VFYPRSFLRDNPASKVVGFLGKMERFILQQSEKADHWVCTDTENCIVCVFQKGKFNDTQKFEMLEDFNPDNFSQLSKIMSDFGNWLRENHYDKIF